MHAHASKFSFSKIPGAPNINIFCENWHEAFYIKEQTQENKFEIWVSSLFFGFDSALKTIDTQIFFWSVGIFENTLKKVIDRQKRLLAIFGG